MDREYGEGRLVVILLEPRDNCMHVSMAKQSLLATRNSYIIINGVNPLFDPSVDIFCQKILTFVHIGNIGPKKENNHKEQQMLTTGVNLITIFNSYFF